MLCCLAGRQIGADYTQLSRRDDETAKTPRYAVARRRVQADSRRVRADREGGVRLHKKTGGQALRPVRSSSPASEKGSALRWPLGRELSGCLAGRRSERDYAVASWQRE